MYYGVDFLELLLEDQQVLEEGEMS